jgi:lipoyl(octanoyl) transferase
VWVGPRKLASIGVHVHRRVATHGLALNVTRASLDGFSAIVPCGMPDVQMTSLEHERDAALVFDDVAAALGRALLAALPAMRPEARRDVQA